MLFSTRPPIPILNTTAILAICVAILLVTLDQLVSMLKSREGQIPSDKGRDKLLVYAGILVVLAKMLFDIFLNRNAIHSSKKDGC